MPILSRFMIFQHSQEHWKNLQMIAETITMTNVNKSATISITEKNCWLEFDKKSLVNCEKQSKQWNLVICFEDVCYLKVLFRMFKLVFLKIPNSRIYLIYINVFNNLILSYFLFQTSRSTAPKIMKGKLDWNTFNLIPILTTKDACFHLRTMEFTLWFVGLAAGLGLRLVKGV